MMLFAQDAPKYLLPEVFAVNYGICSTGMSQAANSESTYLWMYII